MLASCRPTMTTVCALPASTPLLCDGGLDLLHQAAFAAPQPAHAPTRMLAEVNDAYDAAFLAILWRLAFDFCGDAHAHLLGIGSDANFAADVAAGA
jgi:hypothetical protein